MLIFLKKFSVPGLVRLSDECKVVQLVQPPHTGEKEPRRWGRRTNHLSGAEELMQSNLGKCLFQFSDGKRTRGFWILSFITLSGFRRSELRSQARLRVAQMSEPFHAEVRLPLFRVRWPDFMKCLMYPDYTKRNFNTNVWLMREVKQKITLTLRWKF